MKRYAVIIAVLALLFVVGCATTETAVKAPAGPMTAKDMVALAKQCVKQVDAATAKANVDAGKYKVILDVREPKEYKMGHVPGAINIPRGVLEFKIDQKITDKTTPVLVYCKVGGRGCLSCESIQKMGYINVENLEGGWKAWETAGYPVE